MPIKPRDILTPILGLVACALAMFILHREAHAYEDSANVVSVTANSGASSSATAVKSGEQYAVHCGSLARYRVCTSSTCVAVSTDYPIFQDKPVDILTGDGTYIAFYGDGASATCRLYLVKPRTLKGYQ